MVKIKLKWNKTTFQDVEVDQTLGVDGFKEVVYKLTVVPKDRQKLMAKGAWVGVLKDTADFANLTIKEGQQVMLMGTSEVVAAPKETISFVEDMTIEDLAQKGAIIPAGLTNLGNTCYMNSTVQCLRYMPELRQALSASQTINLSSLLRATFDELDRSGSGVPPYSFVHNLRSNFPQYAEQRQGRYMQQDAEEFYNTLLSVVQRDIDRTSTPFRNLLGIEMEERLTCQETDQEAPIVRTGELVNKIVCNIQGGSGASLNIDHMHEGIKLGLEGTVEKFSDVLQRNAVWDRKQAIASLPKYVCVQFMRFFWKATPDSRDHTGIKCKILRSVSFPETFDVFEFCNATLQEKLRYNRQQAAKAFDEEMAKKRTKTEGEGKGSISSAAATATAPPAAPATATAPPAAPADTDAGAGAMDVGGIDTEGMDPEEAAALRAALQMSMQEEDGADAPPAAAPPAASAVAAASASAVASSAGTESKDGSSATTSTTTVTTDPGPIGNGLPDNFSGNYELHALVTHKGRSADSGHYIGWVRQAPGSAFWWCYDDDKVTEVRTEDIMKLGGGGDREMAYLNFYRYKDTAAAAAATDVAANGSATSAGK